MILSLHLLKLLKSTKKFIDLVSKKYNDNYLHYISCTKLIHSRCKPEENIEFDNGSEDLSDTSSEPEVELEVHKCMHAFTL